MDYNGCTGLYVLDFTGHSNVVGGWMTKRFGAIDFTSLDKSARAESQLEIEAVQFILILALNSGQPRLQLYLHLYLYLDIDL